MASALRPWPCWSQRDTIANNHEYWNGTDPWTTDPAPTFDISNLPGCYYWGESDGDGIPQTQDKATLANAIAGLPANYTKVTPGWMVQDLDGDGVLMTQDLTLLKNFMLNLPAGIVKSQATGLESEDAPPAAVAVGSTTHVTVRVRNFGGVINQYSPGFSVVFTVDPLSEGTAKILGGEGSYDGGRFDVSGPGGIADGGHARVTLVPLTAGTIVIHARIPSCGLSGLGKWMDEVVLEPDLSFEAVTP